MTAVHSPLSSGWTARRRFADRPPEERNLIRDQVRLQVATPTGLFHARFADLADFLTRGDVLVVNTSATVPGQLAGRSSIRGAVVVHIAAAPDENSRVVELRSDPDASTPILDGQPGELIHCAGDVRLRLKEPYPARGSSPSGQGNRLWRAEPNDTEGLAAITARYGRPISYGYLAQRYGLDAYQTVFGRDRGSAEMPSAGRPFTTALVTELVTRGILFAPVLLHTGVSSQEAGESPLPERFAVSEQTARLVNTAKATGGRIIAVGTSATRAIESATGTDRQVSAAHGWTGLVISPQRGVRVVDSLITGWHDPEASHLMLVESVAGTGLTRAAYDTAIENDYLWHEFGDSCLFLSARESQ
ncbi:MAG: S-adenosylmethionine:tRNA ribosyltransferase-isomerase [Ornithinimicrobium sp.]